MMFVTVLLALIATLNVSCTVVEESRMAGNGNGGPPMYPQPSRERFMMEDREALAHRPYPQDPRMSDRHVAGPPMGRGNREAIPQPRGEGRLTITGWEKMNGKLRPGGVIHWFNQSGEPVCASQVNEKGKRLLEADLRSRGYTGPITHYRFTSTAPHTQPPTLPEDQRIPLENLPEPDGGSLLPPYPADDGAAPPLPEWAPSAPSSQFVRA